MQTTQTTNAFECFKGETLKFSFNVSDANGDPYTAIATARFVLQPTSGTLVTKAMTVAGNNVSVVVAEAETLLLDGRYTWEARVKGTDTDVDSLATGSLYVKSGPIKIAM